MRRSELGTHPAVFLFARTPFVSSGSVPKTTALVRQSSSQQISPDYRNFYFPFHIGAAKVPVTVAVPGYCTIQVAVSMPGYCIIQ